MTYVTIVKCRPRKSVQYHKMDNFVKTLEETEIDFKDRYTLHKISKNRKLQSTLIQ